MLTVLGIEKAKAEGRPRLLTDANSLRLCQEQCANKKATCMQTGVWPGRAGT